MSPAGNFGGIQGNANPDVDEFCGALRRLATRIDALEIQAQSLSDVVVAFAVSQPGNPDVDPCPSGWSLYKRASGRVIVGVGPADEPFASGGAREHRLTVEEMPAHAHNGKFKSQRHATSNSGRHADYWGKDFNVANETHSTGGNRPHNNMPPYLALYLCKRDR